MAGMEPTACSGCFEHGHKTSFVAGPSACAVCGVLERCGADACSHLVFTTEVTGTETSIRPPSLTYLEFG